MYSKLEVALPKFKLEQSYSLHSLLPEMGMTSVFSNTANLTKLSTNEGLMVSEVSCQLNIQFQYTLLYELNLNYVSIVSQVLHKAVIEVDEVGTTAAAATTVGIIPYSLPYFFSVSRPFFFFIYHENTNSILFMGRVTDPTKN